MSGAVVPDAVKAAMQARVADALSDVEAQLREVVRGLSERITWLELGAADPSFGKMPAYMQQQLVTKHMGGDNGAVHDQR